MEEGLWCVDEVEAAIRLGMAATCFAFAGLDYWSWILPVLVVLSGAWWRVARGGDFFETAQCMLASFLLAVCAYSMMKILLYLEEEGVADFWPGADLMASGALAGGLVAGFLSRFWPRHWTHMALSACRAVTGGAVVVLAAAVVPATVFSFVLGEMPPTVSGLEFLFVVVPVSWATVRVLASAWADGFLLGRGTILWTRNASPAQLPPP